MLDKYIAVNGKTVRLKPYSEKRLKQLNEVNAEIDQYVKENPDVTIDQVPAKLRMGWRKRKIAILWDGELDDKTIESDDFESSLLKDTEDFFISRRLYL